MASRKDQKKILINRKFVENPNKVLREHQVHVNPAFLLKPNINNILNTAASIENSHSEQSRQFHPSTSFHNVSNVTQTAYTQHNTSTVYNKDNFSKTTLNLLVKNDQIASTSGQYNDKEEFTNYGLGKDDLPRYDYNTFHSLEKQIPISTGNHKMQLSDHYNCKISKEKDKLMSIVNPSAWKVSEDVENHAGTSKYSGIVKSTWNSKSRSQDFSRERSCPSINKNKFYSRLSKPSLNNVNENLSNKTLFNNLNYSNQLYSNFSTSQNRGSFKLDRRNVTKNNIDVSSVDNYPSNNFSSRYKINKTNSFNKQQQYKTTYAINRSVGNKRSSSFNLNSNISNNNKSLYNNSLKTINNIKTTDKLDSLMNQANKVLDFNNKLLNIKCGSDASLVQLKDDNILEVSNKTFSKVMTSNVDPSLSQQSHIKDCHMNCISPRASLKISPLNSYKIVSRTKLIRKQPNSDICDNNKYSVKTKTKLIRRKSNEKYASIDKSNLSFNKKYSILSKTKLIRRKSCTSLNKSLNMLNQSIDAHTGISTSNSLMQRTAKDITSKYKVIRTKSSLNKDHNKYTTNYRTGTPNTLKKYKSIFPNKKGDIRRSHQYVNVGGTLYKSNQTSMKKQNTNTAIVQKCGKQLYKSDKFVQINGSMYKSTQTSLKKQMSLKSPINSSRQIRQSRQFSSGKASCYVNIRGSTYKSTKMSLKRHTKPKKRRNVNIGGILYKCTNTSLKKQERTGNKPNRRAKKRVNSGSCILHLRGHQFTINRNGRTLKRVNSESSTQQPSIPRLYIGGLTYVQTKSDQYELTQHHRARMVLNLAKQRSLAVLSHQRRKVNYKKETYSKSNEHCMFYNRFGRCARKDKGQCIYIHNPEMVAVCTRFLRGRCKLSNCQFSHKVDPDKMPVCSHFLQTACTKVQCLYRHVKVNPNAPICTEFLKGHCTEGQKCKKQHVLVCDQFLNEGKCSRGKDCPLSHRKSKIKKKKKKKKVTEPYYTAIFSKRNSRISESNLLALGDQDQGLHKHPNKKVIKGNKKVRSLQRYFVTSENNNCLAELPLEDHPDVQNNNLDDKTMLTDVSLSVDSDLSCNELSLNNKRRIELEDIKTCFNEKRKRILAKVDKLVIPFMSTMLSTPAIKDDDDVIDNVLPINDDSTMEKENLYIPLKFRPFFGVLPDYIPLVIED